MNNSVKSMGHSADRTMTRGASDASLPGLESDGFNDPVPLSSVRARRSVGDGQGKEDSLQSTAKDGVLGHGGAKGRGDGAVCAAARRRNFYQKTKKGYLIPREDIWGISERPERKPSSKNAPTEVQAEEESPLTSPRISCSSHKPQPDHQQGGAAARERDPNFPGRNEDPATSSDLPSWNDVEECPVEGSAQHVGGEWAHVGEWKPVVSYDDDKEGESVDRAVLQLRVKGTDIRQDSAAPYQVYILEASLGRRLWEVEKTLVDFCDLAHQLEKSIPVSLLPRAPPRPAIFTKEDVGHTMAELDMYVRMLACTVLRFEEEGQGDTDSAYLMHLVHTLYKFVDFVEGSGSLSSRLEVGDSQQPLQTAVLSGGNIDFPAPSENSEEQEIEELLAARKELRRLHALLIEVQDKGRSEAEVKKDLGRAVVRLSENIKELQERQVTIRRRMQECMQGPHANDEDASTLSRLRVELRQARIEELSSVMGGASGGTDGWNDPVGLGGRQAVDADEEEKEKLLDRVMREASVLSRPPMDGGRGKGNLLSGQCALMLVENARVWRSVIEMAHSTARAQHLLKSMNIDPQALLHSPTVLEGSQAGSRTASSSSLSAQTLEKSPQTLAGTPQALGGSPHTVGGQRDWGKGAAEVVGDVSGALLGAVKGLIRQLEMEQRRQRQLKLDAEALEYCIERARQEIHEAARARDKHLERTSALTEQARKLTSQLSHHHAHTSASAERSPPAHPPTCARNHRDAPSPSPSSTPSTAHTAKSSAHTERSSSPIEADDGDACPPLPSVSSPHDQNKGSQLSPLERRNQITQALRSTLDSVRNAAATATANAATATARDKKQGDVAPTGELDHHRSSSGGDSHTYTHDAMPGTAGLLKGSDKAEEEEGQEDKEGQWCGGELGDVPFVPFGTGLLDMPPGDGDDAGSCAGEVGSPVEAAASEH